MGQGKTAMDLRLVGILWSEEGVELLLGVDLAGMLLAECGCAVE